MSRITGFRSYDLRFPTSEELDGSLVEGGVVQLEIKPVGIAVCVPTQGHGNEK